MDSTVDNLERVIEQSIGYDAVRVSLAPGVGGLTHRTIDDRDGLVQRIAPAIVAFLTSDEAVERAVRILDPAQFHSDESEGVARRREATRDMLLAALGSLSLDPEPRPNWQDRTSRQADIEAEGVPADGGIGLFALDPDYEKGAE